MNFLKTAILLAGMTALFVGIGYMLGGLIGMVLAFGVALAMNAFAYWNSDRMVLSMHGAHEVDRSTAPDFYKLVKDLATKSNLPMPRVFLIETAQPNAFATGRNPDNAAVAATTGLLEQLTKEEISGVMAHELAHIQNRDTLIMTITATIAGAISILANFSLFFGSNRNNPLGLAGTILLMVLAPLAAMLVQSAISRTREYSADKRGAEICGNPLWLASALETLDQTAQKIENRDAEKNPSSAHLFIVNPLRGGSIDNLFSTHPNTKNRVAALRHMVLNVSDQQTRTNTVSLQKPGKSTIPRSGGHKRRRFGPWR